MTAPHPTFFTTGSVLQCFQPSKRHAYAQSGDNVFSPVERELIFDIVSSYSLSSFCILIMLGFQIQLK